MLWINTYVPRLVGEEGALPASIPFSTLEKFTTFGDLLRFLRRRAGLTQLELSIAVGYSNTQICRLEQNLRLPDPPTIEARFVPALYLNEEPQVVARLIELASTVRREDIPEPGMCPYKGLDFFDETDAKLFIGREALTAELMKRVLELTTITNDDGIRFLAIVGASGSGKSSLVRAGLVPALRWNKQTSGWQIYITNPTALPLESMASVLTEEIGSLSITTSLIDDLRRDPRCLDLYIKRQMKKSGATRSLLVIDQFEELFILCRSDEERTAFIDNLLIAASNQEGTTLVVITLRADFYVHCANYPRLREALTAGQVYIGSLSQSEMRRAIKEPATLGHWDLESGLVNLILQDVGHEPGALPLLSHALLETWQRRHGRRMTLSGYSCSGGVRGAIAETAETVYIDQLNKEQQVIARRIFLCLTELGEETATGDTRRQVKFSELILKPEEADATQAVIRALADARLITTSEDSVQVAHEALIREWPTLRGWLEDNREGLRLHRQLTQATQEWIAMDLSADMLYRGARLVQAKEWAAQNAGDMSDQEHQFLVASVAASEMEVAEQEARLQRELHAAQQLAEAERLRAEEERRSARRLRRRAIYLSLAFGLTLILGVVAISFARQATINASLALDRQSTAAAASRLALNEINTRSTAEAVAINQQLMAQAASTFAFNQSNTRATAEAQAKSASEVNYSLLMAGEAQKAQQAGQADLALALALEAVKSSQPPAEAVQALSKIAVSPGTRFILDGQAGPVSAIAVSPDSHTAISAHCNQKDDAGACIASSAVLWDLDAHRELRHWTASAGLVNLVAYSPDGQTLITAGEDGAIRLWDSTGYSLISEFKGVDGDINAVVISGSTEGSGYTLWSGSSTGSITQWDFAGGKKIWEARYDSPVTSMAISDADIPGGQKVITGHIDGSIALWQANRASPTWRNKIQAYPVTSVAINSTGDTILASSYMYLHLIDGQTGQVQKASETGGMLQQISLSPNGRYIFINGEGVLDQWDVTNWREKQWFLADNQTLSTFALSQDGQIVVAGYSDGSIRVWSVIEALDYQLYNTQIVNSAIDVSQDGKSLLIGSLTDRIQSPVLWDITKANIGLTFPDFNAQIPPNGVVFSPDGRLVAAAGGSMLTDTPSLLVWDSTSGNLLCNLVGHSSIVRSLDFSPDGRFLLSGTQGAKNDLILWDVSTCQPVKWFEMDENEDVCGIAFSSDGSQAITGSAYWPRIIRWDISTGQEIQRYSTENNTEFILDVAFGPEDTTILASSMSTIYEWDTVTGEIIRSFRGNVDAVWSLDLSPDGRYLLSGANNGTVILWDFLTGEELYRLDPTTSSIYGTTFSPDSSTAYAVSTDGTLLSWKITTQTLPELIEWINTHRYVRTLSCSEKERYRVEPLCAEGNP